MSVECKVPPNFEGKLKEHLAQCGVKVTKSVVSFTLVELLVVFDKMEESFPERSLIHQLKQSVLTTGMTPDTCSTLLFGLQDLYDRYQWASAVVDDLDRLASLRDAISTRKRLVKSIKALGVGNFNDDMKALNSVATRILIEQEMSEDDRLYDLAAFFLAEIADMLCSRKEHLEFFQEVQMIFLGQNFLEK